VSRGTAYNSDESGNHAGTRVHLSRFKQRRDVSRAASIVPSLIEQVFVSWSGNRRRTMASRERPGPAFVALRAAALGVDDISRQALREWLMEALDHRGQIVGETTDPTEPATRTIVAAILTLTDAERLAYRRWFGRWTDYSGRVITPHEQRQRLEAIRTQRD
jgi:hypothetical protein